MRKNQIYPLGFIVYPARTKTYLHPGYKIADMGIVTVELVIRDHH